MVHHLLVPRAIKLTEVVFCGDKGLGRADFDFNHGVSYRKTERIHGGVCDARICWRFVGTLLVVRKVT